jgi:predicted RNA-binding Zn-ribbon protein involved in translation (DUF1610 family)
MIEINIVGAIEELLVYNDYEFCNDGLSRCRFLNGNRCGIFFDNQGINLSLNRIGDDVYRKCGQCKEALKELEEQKTIKLCPGCGEKLNHVDGCENDDCSYPPF